MSIKQAYKYARLCSAQFLEENPRHESAFYEPWDYILKAIFPLSEGYAVIGQLALIKRTAIHAKGPTPDFVVCTQQGLGYPRVSFMAVEIKNAGEDRDAAAEQLFEYMEFLANEFANEDQTYVYGLLSIGFDWCMYRLRIAGKARPGIALDWMTDYASDSSLEELKKLKQVIIPMVEVAEESSKTHSEVHSSASPSSSTSPPPPIGSPAQSQDPKGDTDRDAPDAPETSPSPHRPIRSIDQPSKFSGPEDDLESEGPQFSLLPRSSTEPSVHSVRPKDVPRGHNPPPTQPSAPSRSIRMKPSVQSIQPKGAPRGDNPSSKQSSTATPHQSMAKSVEPQDAPQEGNTIPSSRASIATPRSGKSNDADVRDSPDPLDLFAPGNGKRGRSQRPMGNAHTSRGPSARRPQAESDDSSSPDELDFFRPDDRHRRFQTEIGGSSSLSGGSGSNPHVPVVGSDPISMRPSASKHPLSKAESNNSNIRPGDVNPSRNSKHTKK